jgi:hypothetical protein
MEEWNNGNKPASAKAATSHERQDPVKELRTILPETVLSVICYLCSAFCPLLAPLNSEGLFSWGRLLLCGSVVPTSDL